MTAIADHKKRVMLPTKSSPIKVRPAKVMILKKDGFTVGKLDHPIDQAALKEALKTLI